MAVCYKQKCILHNPKLLTFSIFNFGFYKLYYFVIFNVSTNKVFFLSAFQFHHRSFIIACKSLIFAYLYIQKRTTKISLRKWNATWKIKKAGIYINIKRCIASFEEFRCHVQTSFKAELNNNNPLDINKCAFNSNRPNSLPKIKYQNLHWKQQSAPKK